MTTEPDRHGGGGVHEGLGSTAGNPLRSPWSRQSAVKALNHRPRAMRIIVRPHAKLPLGIAEFCRRLTGWPARYCEARIMRGERYNEAVTRKLRAGDLRVYFYLLYFFSSRRTTNLIISPWEAARIFANTAQKWTVGFGENGISTGDTHFSCALCMKIKHKRMEILEPVFLPVWRSMKFLLKVLNAVLQNFSAFLHWMCQRRRTVV